MDYIENRTFDEIRVGESAHLSRTLSKEDILLFAAVSGDVNPAHVDEEFARSEMFHKVIAHGMWGAALISTVLGTLLPGPGTIYLGQTLRFKRPVAVGDTVTVTVTAQEKIEDRRRVIFECRCTNQAGDAVIEGTAEVMAPREKIKRPRVILPQVRVYDEFARYRELLGLTEGLEPIRVAVAHPVDKGTLFGVKEAADAGLIIPVLVGPEARIRSAAGDHAIDLNGFELVSTEHSHAAAAEAVALARAGKVDALMKGALAREELLAAAAAADGIRTDRRMSHVYAVDVPGYPRALFLTDAVLNVHPRLAAKRDIVQNAIELLQALGRDRPKVAILSALERIDPGIESTLEAAALCKMAERGQITGGIVDGPLGFDTAVARKDEASVQGTLSPIAGSADILVVPDLEAGQILVKQLEHLAGARAIGMVLGARVPIILPDPDDTARERTAACALALLLVQMKRQGGRGLTPALSSS